MVGAAAVAGDDVDRGLRVAGPVPSGWGTRRSGAASSPFWKRIERQLYGIPDDHPALHQLVAEVRYLDECREDRRRARLGRGCRETRQGAARARRLA